MQSLFVCTTEFLLTYIHVLVYFEGNNSITSGLVFRFCAYLTQLVGEMFNMAVSS